MGIWSPNQRVHNLEPDHREWVTTVYRAWLAVHKIAQRTGMPTMKTAALHMQHGLHLLLEAHYPIGPEDVLSISVDPEDLVTAVRVTSYPREEFLTGFAHGVLPPEFPVGLNPDNLARLDELRKEG